MDTATLQQFDHDAWRALAGTAVGYLGILTVMFVVLFVLPLVVFRVL
jgi:uncharacterized membrane protein YtjA (UPF0391 family)